MSRRKRRHKKSRKRLTYGIIVAFFTILCFLTYFHLQSNQTHGDQTSQPNAAIVDQLSFRNETANQTFVDASEKILKKVGFDVDYYGGNEVSVTFYKYLLTQDYSSIVLRVHSAMIGNNTDLGLFTSEPLDESKYNSLSAPYYDDVLNKRIVNASFPEDPIYYFAIAPRFVKKYGTFQNTIVIMMGCDGLKYNNMAKAFIERGAKVCIGWDGLVSTPHTDHATTRLLQHLAQGNTVEEAVEKTMNEVGPEEMYFKDQGYESTLEYYPPNAGSYTIQYTLGTSSTDNVRAGTVLVKEEKKGTRLNRL